MKKLEWFYFIAAVLGFCVDLSTLVAFFVQSRSSGLGFEPRARSAFAILSILTLFYGMFAFASWRYWIWLGVYAERLAYSIEAFDEWKKDRDENLDRYAESHTNLLEILKYEELLNDRSPMPPGPPDTYGRSGVYLAIGLGILAYPLLAIWGLTFIPDIIWSTNSLEFIGLLVVPSLCLAYQFSQL
jgi:hypothetical protein